MLQIDFAKNIDFFNMGVSGTGGYHLSGLAPPNLRHGLGALRLR